MARPLSGRTVLWTLVGAFAIVFAVNGIFIAEAVTTFRGGDEQSPYLQGLEYNRTLTRHAEQARLGWSASIAVERAGADARVTVRLTARDGSPVRSEQLTGEFRHPADAHRDRAFRLAEAEAGRFTAMVPGIESGVWDVVIRAGNKQRPFEAERRLWLR